MPTKQIEETKLIRNLPAQIPASTSLQLYTSQQDLEVEEEAGLELPPPMKPIQEPHLIANGPPTFSDDNKINTAQLVGARSILLYKLILFVFNVFF